MTPTRLTRPALGMSPARPQKDAGPRMEPPVSEPIAQGARPAATVMKALRSGSRLAMRSRYASVNSRGESLRALMSLDASATVRKHSASDMGSSLGQGSARGVARAAESDGGVAGVGGNV